MNDVVRSIATTGASTARTRRQRTEQALSLRDTPRGASSDREFLAPVLEILKTPASPVRVAFLWIICALVVVGLGLASSTITAVPSPWGVIHSWCTRRAQHAR